jgi:DNA-directed RNA polymerase specialized sigma subunit
MPDPHDSDDDDKLAEAIADAWVERAAHDSNLRRIALIAAGKRQWPADMTTSELARHLGTSRRTISRIESDVIKRLRLDPKTLRILREIHPTNPPTP